MRTIATTLAALLLLAGCGTPDWTKQQVGETLLPQVYAAMGDPYPLREPVFLGCGYYRLVGQEQHHSTDDLHNLMIRPDDVDGSLSLLDWKRIACGDKPLGR